MDPPSSRQPARVPLGLRIWFWASLVLVVAGVTLALYPGVRAAAAGHGWRLRPGWESAAWLAIVAAIAAGLAIIPAGILCARARRVGGIRYWLTATLIAVFMLLGNGLAVIVHIGAGILEPGYRFSVDAPEGRTAYYYEGEGLLGGCEVKVNVAGGGDLLAREVFAANPERCPSRPRIVFQGPAVYVVDDATGDKIFTKGWNLDFGPH